MTTPDIQVGVEELDVSEAELIEYQEDITIRSRASAIPGAKPGALASSAKKSLPSYEIDEEDPMDGTTSLPLQSSYPSSYAPDSLDDQALPAFPLEDSVPAGPPSHPPSIEASLRSSPVPQISLARAATPDFSAPQPEPQPAWGAQKFSRPVSRTEPRESARPSVAAARTSPPTSTAPSSSVLARAESRRPPSIGPAAPGELPEAESVGELPIAKASESLPTISMDELEAVSVGPSLSMDELEAVSVGPSFVLEEPSASVMPPIPSAPVSSPPALESVPPSSARKAPPSPLPTLDFDSSPAPAPVSESPPARTERQSVAPVHVDRDTPIPSSASSLKGISIRGISLGDVRGLCDLPEESHRLLRQRARVERMGTGEDLSFFSVVLVLEGWVKLMPAIADVTCATAAAGEVVFTQGTLEDGVALRVVAGQNGTTLATWDRETFEAITQSCPWVADELRLIADSFQALAGVALGMLGERLDDALREVVTSRCQVLTLLPNEVLVAEGKPVPGMHIVGAGLIELVDSSGSIISTVAPGDFLLTAQVLAGGVSPHTVRAASTGALVLFAPRMVAHEMLVSVPPLLEILAG